MPIKTKEFASLLVAAVAAIVVAAAMWLLEAVWWQTLCVACAVFVGMTLLTLFIIRKYVAYKLKPIYSIVLSRNVHTQEILDELKDKHVENISEELTPGRIPTTRRSRGSRKRNRSASSIWVMWPMS